MIVTRMRTHKKRNRICDEYHSHYMLISFLVFFVGVNTSYFSFVYFYNNV